MPGTKPESGAGAKVKLEAGDRVQWTVSMGGRSRVDVGADPCLVALPLADAAGNVVVEYGGLYYFAKAADLTLLKRRRLQPPELTDDDIGITV